MIDAHERKRRAMILCEKMLLETYDIFGTSERLTALEHVHSCCKGNSVNPESYLSSTLKKQLQKKQH